MVLFVIQFKVLNLWMKLCSTFLLRDSLLGFQGFIHTLPVFAAFLGFAVKEGGSIATSPKRTLSKYTVYTS